MAKDLVNEVKINPNDKLQLAPNSPVDLRIQNTGRRALTYKLKVTRPASVKPTKAFGVVQPNNEDVFKVNFKPTPAEKPFGTSDRLTILVAAMPGTFAKPEHFWKTPQAVNDAQRFVVMLEQKGGAAAAAPAAASGKKPAGKEKEEDKKSEETEAESGAESGATESGGTESEA